MATSADRWVGRAKRVLAGEPVLRDEARAILDAPDADLDELLRGAFVLRSHYHGRGVKLHVLLNAKSGLCPENCTFCSQSAYAATPIETYKLLPQEEMVEAARRARDAGAWKF